MDRAFSTLRRRRACVVNPTAKTDVSGRQVAKLLGSNSGRQSRVHVSAAFMSRAMARFRDERKGGIPDDDIDGETAESRATTTPEATKPLDGVCVRLHHGEIVFV